MWCNEMHCIQKVEFLLSNYVYRRHLEVYCKIHKFKQRLTYSRVYSERNVYTWKTQTLRAITVIHMLA